MKIYHTPLFPYTGEEKLYRPTREYYDGEADTPRDYILDLLAEDDGSWRVTNPGEVIVLGQIPLPYYVLRCDHPGEPPILIAYFGK